MRFVLTTALCLAPFAALAAGSSDSKEPEDTDTTQMCEEGLVFDIATETCMPPEESTNEDQALLDDIRALAHRGEYAAALGILDSLDDRNSDLALTYYGFVTRKAGDMERGMEFYELALGQNADNLLVRSYMGQAFVEQGEMTLAMAQLTEIRMRGGRDTWAEASLADAIETGEGYSY